MEWKIMTFIVATNVIASRPPKRRPNGTRHARAKRNFGSQISLPDVLPKLNTFDLSLVLKFISQQELSKQSSALAEASYPKASG